MAKTETLTKEVNSFVVAESIGEALQLFEEGKGRDTEERAWDRLTYWEREENQGPYHVYESVVEQKVTRIA